MQWLRSILADLNWGGPIKAALIVVAAFVLARLVDWLVVRLLRVWTRRSATQLDDRVVEILHGPVIKTVVLCGLYLAAAELLPSENGDSSYLAFTENGLLTIVVLMWTAASLRLSGILLQQASRVQTKFLALEERTFPLFNNLSKVLLVAAGLYALIVIWGWNATGWLASAGIVGIALGLAAQDTLANLFAGVSIIADAPYTVGDYINLESGERGQVVNIGLRSTRLLTRDDIEITIPNSVMGGARITNESAGGSQKRRVRVQVGVAYGSDLEQVRRILLEVAREVDNVCEQPEPRVRFRSFGDSGLNFELLCWIPEPVLRGWVLDALNTRVYERFREEAVEIPYPQRDLHVRELPPGLPTGAGGDGPEP